jgi:hypothetical protein
MFATVGFVVLACVPVSADEPSVGVGAQYDGTHVYVAPADLDRFTASQTLFQAVITPVGDLSTFGFTTPVPSPFGVERTGYLVTDMDAAIRAASADGAAIVLWPGGVYMQFYWHTVAPHYEPLVTVPENRVYVAAEKADEFVRDSVAFSGGHVVSDDAAAPGVEIGRPGETYRRVRVESVFGKMVVLVTDGHLPYPFGRETTGYASDGRRAAIVEFPGGYVAEIHASLR